jgi:hypothetical protein
MVAIAHVRFLVGVNYRVDLFFFKKIISPVKPGFGCFLSREKVFLLNENRGGGVTPTGLVLNYAPCELGL